MRTIDDYERRARLALRHHLAHPSPATEQVAADMVGLHSSDPATVYLSAHARVNGFTVANMETALYEDRSLVRMLGMRRTLFVVPRRLAAVMNESCTKAFVATEHRRLVTMIQDQGLANDGEVWLTRVEEMTLAALDELEEAPATELAKRVPELTAKLRFGEGKTWGATVGVSTRVLFLLATKGQIVRTRPRGTWASGQYRWTRTERWLGEPLPSLDHDEASRELLERWLAAFGPATITDIRWWTGWTARLATATLAALGAPQVELQGGAIGFVLSEDEEPAGRVSPWVGLLPGLDPTTMGWKERAWYIGEHAPRLFDRNGNAGPTVWVNGRVVGGWACAPGGQVVIQLLEPVTKSAERAVEREGRRLSAWLDGTRIRSRFPTPLEQELAR
jgi:hypothetical protein